MHEKVQEEVHEKFHEKLTTRWYNFETFSQTDDFRRAAVESAHIGQAVNSIAR